MSSGEIRSGWRGWPNRHPGIVLSLVLVAGLLLADRYFAWRGSAEPQLYVTDPRWCSSYAPAGAATSAKPKRASSRHMLSAALS